jgi:hypothetical protein
MRHIEVSMFPEFEYMIYILGFIIAFGVFTAIINRRPFLYAFVVLIIVTGAASCWEISVCIGRIDRRAVMRLAGFFLVQRIADADSGAGRIVLRKRRMRKTECAAEYDSKNTRFEVIHALASL